MTHLEYSHVRAAREALQDSVGQKMKLLLDIRAHLRSEPAWQEAWSAHVQFLQEELEELAIEFDRYISCGAVGPQESWGPCILNMDHPFDHRDEAGGSWLS